MALLNFFSQQGEAKKAQQMESDRMDMILGGSGRPGGAEFNPLQALSKGGGWQDPNEPGGENMADERMKQMGKVSDALSTINESQYGVNRDQLKTMSLGQKRGLLDRMRLQEVFAERQQQQQLHQAQMMEALSRNQYYGNRMAQETSDRSNLSKFNRAYWEEPPRVLNPEALAQRQTPEGRAAYATSVAPEALGSPQADSLLNAFSRMHPQRTGWNLAPDQTYDVGGQKMIPTSQNSAQPFKPELKFLETPRQMDIEGRKYYQTQEHGPWHPLSEKQESMVDKYVGAILAEKFAGEGVKDAVKKKITAKPAQESKSGPDTIVPGQRGTAKYGDEEWEIEMRVDGQIVPIRKL